MTPLTWEKLKSYGVTEETSLTLDFMYYASSKSSAVTCMNHLRELGDEVSIEPENSHTPNGMWLVTGHTQPTEIDKDILLQWVDHMVSAGWELGGYFDGWGTEIP
ncbi:MAG: ribonuclease E inhibitor RraB [Desulfuromonadaceae bacterium]